MHVIEGIIIMSNQQSQNMVVKISTALSNKPLFVRISDDTMSIDRVFVEAISTLRNGGKPLEAKQLEDLFKAHQIFNNGKVVQKGDLFRELEKKSQTIGNQTVQVAELDLISSHHGGMDSTIQSKNFFITFQNVVDPRLLTIQNLKRALTDKDCVFKPDQIFSVQEIPLTLQEQLEHEYGEYLLSRLKKERDSVDKMKMDHDLVCVIQEFLKYLKYRPTNPFAV